MEGQLHEDIRQFITGDLGKSLTGIGNDASLLEAGVLDSLGVLALVNFIEGKYGVTVSEDEMMPENFDSIDAVAAFVGRRRGGAGA